MIGKGSAIRMYQRKLSPELSKRYGGPDSYTPAQVERTIDDLGLSRKYIRYAYLMYCEQEMLDREIFSQESIERMNATIAAAAGRGIVAAPIDSLFSSSSNDGIGFGDGGGGGE